MPKKPKSKAAPAAATTQQPISKPLPRGPHTVQLLFHAAVHSLLVLLCTVVLPAHLVSRQTSEGAESEGSLQDASTSSAHSLIASVANYFTLSANPHNEQLLKRAAWGTLQAIVVVQAWAVMRFRKWYDLGAAIDSGDRAAAQVVTKEGWAKGAERMAMTTLVSLPGAVPLAYAVLVLFGASPVGDFRGTLLLALAISLMVALPLLHVLPDEMEQWTRILSFSSSSPASSKAVKALSHPRSVPRERLIVYQAVLPIVGSLAASAALTLDHGKAWLVWPLPPCLGLYLGAALADVVGALHYILDSPA